MDRFVPGVLLHGGLETPVRLRIVGTARIVAVQRRVGLP
jgi:hypothetical protein